VNRFGLSNLGIGLGLRTVHYADILERQPAVDWFEIISENYMQTQGPLGHALSGINAEQRVVEAWFREWTELGVLLGVSAEVTAESTEVRGAAHASTDCRKRLP
jgi:hypothetical protein